MMFSKKQSGDIGEEAASRYLEKKGYKILKRNFSCKQGEIDIIALDGGCIVFVEVKNRQTRLVDYGFEAVDINKQRKICMAARMYLLKNEIDFDTEMRYDVIDIYENEITHYESAFYDALGM